MDPGNGRCSVCIHQQQWEDSHCTAVHNPTRVFSLVVTVRPWKQCWTLARESRTPALPLHQGACSACREMTADGWKDKLTNPGMVWHSLGGLCMCEWVGWGAEDRPQQKWWKGRAPFQQLTAALQAQAESHTLRAVGRAGVRGQAAFCLYVFQIHRNSQHIPWPCQRDGCPLPWWGFSLLSQQ